MEIESLKKDKLDMAKKLKGMGQLGLICHKNKKKMGNINYFEMG